MTIEVEGVRGCSTVYSALSLSPISKSSDLTDRGRPLTSGSYTLCLVLIAYSFEQAALVRLTMKMPVQIHCDVPSCDRLLSFHNRIDTR